MVLESYKYFRYLKRSLLNRGGLNYLIVYVTSRCNSACRSCFFHEGLNKADDLSLEEYRKISGKLGHLSVLLLSGGEPFLRNDLIQICGTFIKNNKIDTLSIPTNGLLTKEILEGAEELAKNFSSITISINPSLDGMQEYHDMFRGVKGNFDCAISTIRGLDALKKKYTNLQIIVNSVINNDNIEELKQLIVYLFQFNIDYHALEIMRGDWKDKGLSAVSADKVRELHKFIVLHRKKIIRNIFERTLVLGALKYIYRIKEGFLLGKKWPLRCAAGRSIAVLYPNGAFSLCELQKPFANVRDENYDIPALLQSERARKKISEITDTGCSCTHVCFLNASVARSWISPFKILFNYFRND